MNEPRSQFVLLIAKKPGFHPSHCTDPDGAWREFLSVAQSIAAPQKGVETLAENIWQIELNAGLLLLADIVRAACRLNIPTCSLVLPQTPDWVKYPVSEDLVGKQTSP